MEHFNIILGLCRSALKEPNSVISGHVERLVKALNKDGKDDEALALQKMLEKNTTNQTLQPSKVVVSKSSISGEILTPSVQPPVDKETSSPLASIFQPDELKNEALPIFDFDLSDSIVSMLEEWKYSEKMKSKGIQPILTMMLYGKPGTGKTMLGHYIARELKIPLVVARLDGLISSYLGTTARNISSLFSFANRYRCVLLLDEFDAVAKLRDDPHELGEIKRVVNTLLQCIDDRSTKGYTVAITNHEALLDPAVWRRFDVRIEIPVPNMNTRIQIFNRLIKKEESEVKIKFLAWLSEGYSGSDIEKLCLFIKRQKVIKGKKYDFFNSVKQYIQLSAKSNETINRSLTVGSPESLVRELSTNKEFDFSQAELSILFDTTQPTICRWLKKS